MLLSEMRTRYSDILAGLGETDTTDIDALLNGAYQYTLPKMVPGQQTDGEWSLDTVASTEAYPMPAYIIAPRAGVYRTTGQLVEFWTRPELFWNRFDRSSTTEGAPTAGLFYGREVKLRPIPDAAYTLKIPARVGPSAALASSGISDFDHAMCVVCLAAQVTAEDGDLTELVVKLQNRLQRHLIPLRRASLMLARQRRQYRTF